MFTMGFAAMGHDGPAMALRSICMILIITAWPQHMQQVPLHLYMQPQVRSPGDALNAGVAPERQKCHM
jgi:hypothetical protein